MQGGPCWRGLMIAGKPMERKGRCVAVWRWKIARFSFCAFSPVPVPSIGRRCVDQWPSVAGPTLAAGNRRVAPSYCRLVLNMAILLKLQIVTNFRVFDPSATITRSSSLKIDNLSLNILNVISIVPVDSCWKALWIVFWDQSDWTNNLAGNELKLKRIAVPSSAVFVANFRLNGWSYRIGLTDVW